MSRRAHRARRALAAAAARRADRRATTTARAWPTRRAARLQALGYTRVHLLDGGLRGLARQRRRAVPRRQRAQQGLRRAGRARRRHAVAARRGGEGAAGRRHRHGGAGRPPLRRIPHDEHPQGTSVPGAELVLRVRDLAPDPATRVIVNCAGRTRSLIGAQSLVNAGIPNPVAALRNGTIGWLLAGFDAGPWPAAALRPRERRANLAAAHRRAGTGRPRRSGAHLTNAGLARLGGRHHAARCTAGTCARPRNTPPATCPASAARRAGSWCRKPMSAPRCAARAWCWRTAGRATTACARPMTAHWLAQMGWEVAWLDDEGRRAHRAGPWRASRRPARPPCPRCRPTLLARAGRRRHAGAGRGHQRAAFVKGHVPGAWWGLRAQTCGRAGRAAGARAAWCSPAATARPGADGRGRPGAG
jgi:rhodanese-related sulfurtransferase